MKSVIERLEQDELGVYDILKTVDGNLLPRCYNDQAESDLLALAKLGEKMRWVPVSERLPDYTKSDIERAKVNVLCKTYGGNKFVTTAVYTANKYAKTEKGRAPRWEDMSGRLLGFEVLSWMPLPEPPKEEG